MKDGDRLWLWKISECFLGFTSDPAKNIQRITGFCGEMMGADCALYNRLHGGLLHSLALWNAPPDFKPVDRPDGHICHDVIRNGGRQVFTVRDLHLTEYADSDPNVSAYGLKTYIGVPVICGNICVGSLCVVYQSDYSPTEEAKKIMQILAAALGVEEERRLEAEALREAKDELERRVEERTAELERVNERLRLDNIDRRDAEESLRKSQILLNKVFESIPDLLAVVDRNLRVVRSNWRGMYEYAPEEIRDLAPNCYRFIHPGQDRPCEPCHALEVFRTAKPVILEKTDPKVGTVEVRAYPVFDDSGEVILVTEHVRNITERKRADMEILRINEELKEKSLMLESAYEELVRKENLTILGRLAGNVGHELLNPLGVMNNAVYYLKCVLQDGAENVKEYLDLIKQEVDISTLIVSDLIDFARIKAPQPRLVTAPELIGMSLVKCMLPRKVELRLDLPDTLPSLEVDPSQIGKVLRNLVFNAIQAMPDGGSLSISARVVSCSGTGTACCIRETETRGPASDIPVSGSEREVRIPKPGTGKCMEIGVQDTGEGIAEENLDKIFQPLFSTRPRGIGLGLSISRQLIELNGGVIDVKSRPGEGSTFTVTLPVGGSASSGTRTVPKSHGSSVSPH